jgi:hypothetical protein
MKEFRKTKSKNSSPVVVHIHVSLEQHYYIVWLETAYHQACLVYWPWYINTLNLFPKTGCDCYQ